ncbi:stress-regulated transcription factor RPN4 [Aspergillus candidus]|uniref:C2H2-type domain-containing protein n=1 Tax=Aspergillus candidus TaxID=41067 RepID=A0A2I2F0G3_ASPCN|nr:hypothetical protein BDW47DRAFT_129305 [Aspergillus candidus]PLB34117.1 hypothetical protein BDW47DRAFT_129305 [Aspergillus candidus]
MFMHPFGRKVPFLNNQDPVCIQDDQLLPEFPHDIPSQYVEPQPHQLESPFQYNPDLQFVSPPSSAPSSPDSSPNSSFSHLPNSTAVEGDYTPAVFDGNCFEAPSMTPAPSYEFSFQLPSSVSPSQSYLPQYPQQYLFGNNPMLTQQPVANNSGWDGNMQLLSPARMHQQQQHQQQHNNNNVARTPQHSHSQNSHSRATSATRQAPAGSSYQRSKPLPTPAQTPVQNSFLAPQFQNYDPSSFDAGANHAGLAMRQAAIDHQQQQQQQQQHKPQQQVHHQHQSSDHSLAPSVSSVSHNSPVTPQTKLEELDDSSKAFVNGETDPSPDIDHWMNEYLRADALSDYANPNSGSMSVGVPKLNRTISDVYQDELYNPTLMVTPQVSKQLAGQQNLLTPQYRNVFADRLQAANQDHLTSRSQSPVGSIKRENSPFRQNSPYSAEFTSSGVPRSQMTTSVPVPQPGLTVSQGVAEPKTMSPKDALLDFHEPDDAGLPLFPAATQSDFTPSTQADFNSSTQADFNLGDALGLRRESSGSFQPSQSFNSMESFPTQYATQPATPQYSFVQQQPQQAQQSAPQPPQAQLPSHPPSTQPQPQDVLQQTPNFPAPLPTFETTQFEPTGNDVLPSTETPEQMMMIHEDISRPANTSADSGTYTCTYHGCTMRFPTPAKLQKHKREAHRQTTPGGHLVGRDSASCNSQAGPHKCERINPSTGKPCNSIFSRPYDLTRHEDTIHNARKQKVRCHLCTEEKTFSRNDALTRHMRVVHPEVDWPGKQRRRGRE